jgi:hypothetical protein
VLISLLSWRQFTFTLACLVEVEVNTQGKSRRPLGQDIGQLRSTKNFDKPPREPSAWQGTGQVALISSAGRDRPVQLAPWLTGPLQAGSYMQLFFQCSPYHKDNALHLSIVQLKNVGLKAKDSIKRRLEKMGITAFNQTRASVAIVKPPPAEAGGFLVMCHPGSPE